MKSLQFSVIIVVSILCAPAGADTGSYSGEGRNPPLSTAAIKASDEIHANGWPERTPVSTSGISNTSELTALPNPVYNRNDKVILSYQTRMAGTAVVNIYDAVGSMVFETTVDLQRPDVVGYKVSIPWDCRNRMGRFVGNGTYLGVIRIFDTDERPVARHTVYIGIAY